MQLKYCCMALCCFIISFVVCHVTNSLSSFVYVDLAISAHIGRKGEILLTSYTLGVLGSAGSRGQHMLQTTV